MYCNYVLRNKSLKGSFCFLFFIIYVYKDCYIVDAQYSFIVVE